MLPEDFISNQGALCDALLKYVVDNIRQEIFTTERYDEVFYTLRVLSGVPAERFITV